MLCLPKQPKGLEAEIEQNIVRDLSMVLYTPLQASTKKKKGAMKKIFF